MLPAVLLCAEPWAGPFRVPPSPLITVVQSRYGDSERASNASEDTQQVRPPGWAFRHHQPHPSRIPPKSSSHADEQTLSWASTKAMRTR